LEILRIVIETTVGSADAQSGLLHSRFSWLWDFLVSSTNNYSSFFSLWPYDVTIR
jgi:hypothetical protein